jgi:GT2 family glycosyltransferase
MVEREYPDVVLQKNQENLGFGAAANQALALCKSEYVMLLNPDTLLERGTLAALSRHLDDNPRASIVGPRLLEADGTLQASCYPFPTPLNTFLENNSLAVFVGRRIRRYLPGIGKLYLRTWGHDRPRTVPWIKGAAWAIRRSAFNAVNGFDESYFMYFEDADLCHRLNSAGWEIHFTPHATVVHSGGASTRQYGVQMNLCYLESTFRFYRKHARRAQLVAATLIIKAIMFARWLNGIGRVVLTPNDARRAEIAAGAAAYRRGLLSGSGTAAAGFRNGKHTLLTLLDR